MPTISTSKHIIVFLLLFFALDLLFIALEYQNMRFFSKALLLPLLILFYIHQTKKNNTERDKNFMIGLLLSWLGDLFLLLPSGFLFGLGSFLLAHLFYSRSFYTLSNTPLRLNYRLLLPILVYLMLFLTLLFPHLNELKIPVVFYAITISFMLYMGYNTRKTITPIAFKNLFFGALLFVVSDSVLALHLFVFRSKFMELLVMITYVLAQYFLIQGMILKKEFVKF
ncbi:lysoplasmalogenase [Flavobacterium sp.]|uniref:lysoplasmalogenase n=1 Tax=Flavobacterium sp. TaxID=239 RepID=UPI00404874B4